MMDFDRFDPVFVIANVIKSTLIGLPLFRLIDKDPIGGATSQWLVRHRNEAKKETRPLIGRMAKTRSVALTIDTISNIESWFLLCVCVGVFSRGRAAARGGGAGGSACGRRRRRQEALGVGGAAGAARALGPAIGLAPTGRHAKGASRRSVPGNQGTFQGQSKAKTRFPLRSCLIFFQSGMGPNFARKLVMFFFKTVSRRIDVLEEHFV